MQRFVPGEEPSGSRIVHDRNGRALRGGPVCTLQKHQTAGSPNQNGSLAEETLERALEGL